MAITICISSKYHNLITGNRLIKNYFLFVRPESIFYQFIG